MLTSAVTKVMKIHWVDYTLKKQDILIIWWTYDVSGWSDGYESMAWD